MSLINMPAHEYHRHPALGSTSLKRALVTPSHYYAFASENPERIVEDETEALVFGRLAHCIVLEDESIFQRDFIVLPEDLDRRTSIGKQVYAQIMAEAGDRTVVKQKQVDIARAMKKQLQKHFVWRYLQNGVSEGSVFWEEKGMQFKVRLDWVKEIENNGLGRIIIDYKTAQCAAIDDFSRQINKLNYHVQVAHYNKGCEIAYGEKPAAFVFIAQDKKPPYAVGAYMIDPQAVVNGVVRRAKAIDIIKEGRETGIWDGYTKKIEVIDLPTYAQFKAAEENENFAEDEETEEGAE